MRITSIQLQNFKRFTDLTIKDIPADAKLVLLIGANGSGKSSVFDAFSLLKKQSLIDLAKKAYSTFAEELETYYSKEGNMLFMNVVYQKNGFEEYVIISYPKDEAYLAEASVSQTLFENTDFYGRSSLRQIPRLTRTRIGQSGVSIKNDDDSPDLFILRDYRFENDIDVIAGNILAEVFKGGKMDTAEIRAKYIAPINQALANIFDNTKNPLELVSLSPPLEQNPAALIFKKGDAKFHYDLLSSGEKEVINILMNLLSRREYFQDTIYYIDEMDVHLNTALQYNLLKEITENWIPKNSQLWTASHSLGFIDYAQQYEHGVIIDFDDHNFDEPQVLVPEPKQNMEVYEIAISKDVIGRIFEGSAIYFVENKDDEHYNSIGLKATIFVPENNKNSVYFKVVNDAFQGIVDRDYLTDEEIRDIQNLHPKLIILPFYSIESYLFHPDNLEEYYLKRNIPFDKDDYIAKIRAEKNRILNDLKYSIAGIRESYPFFKEKDLPKAKQKFEKRYKKGSENIKFSKQIGQSLSSDNFAEFYPYFSMKDYGKSIPQRQNITYQALTKTVWFEQAVKQLLKK